MLTQFTKADPIDTLSNECSTRCTFHFIIQCSVHQSQPLTDLINLRFIDELIKNHFTKNSIHTIPKILRWKISLKLEFHSVLSQMHQISNRKKRENVLHVYCIFEKENILVRLLIAVVERHACQPLDFFLVC